MIEMKMPFSRSGSDVQVEVTENKTQESNPKETFKTISTDDTNQHYHLLLVWQCQSPK